MKKLLDYVNWPDVSKIETLRIPTLTLPTKSITLPGYAYRVAQHHARLDGLTVEEYIARLIYKDEYERRDLAALD